HPRGGRRRAVRAGRPARARVGGVRGRLHGRPEAAARPPASGRRGRLGDVDRRGDGPPVRGRAARRGGRRVGGGVAVGPVAGGRAVGHGLRPLRGRAGPHGRLGGVRAPVPHPAGGGGDRVGVVGRDGRRA